MRAAAPWLREIPIAHRGLHGDRVPENTLAAFGAAAAAGYAIELDVQLSADDVPMVFHDYRMSRLTTVRERVARLRAEDLASVSILDTDQTVARLSEVLAVVDGRVPIYVELKPQPRPAPLCTAVAEALAGYGGAVAILSFDPRIVLWFRMHLPEVPRGQSAGRFHLRWIPRAVQLPYTAMITNVVTWPDFLAYDILALPNRALDAWRRVLGAPLVLWSVHTSEQLALARDLDANVMFEGLRP